MLPAKAKANIFYQPEPPAPKGKILHPMFYPNHCFRPRPNDDLPRNWKVMVVTGERDHVKDYLYHYTLDLHPYYSRWYCDAEDTDPLSLPLEERGRIYYTRSVIRVDKLLARMLRERSDAESIFDVDIKVINNYKVGLPYYDD